MWTAKSLIFLFSLSLAAVCDGQDKKPQGGGNNSSSNENRDAQMKRENSLLWEISGKGLNEPSYLYGTMHIVCADDARMSDGLKKVIGRAKQVFFEVDMDNMEEMMGVLRYARMNNGLSISDLVTPVEYSRIEEYFSNNKSMVPFAMMTRFKPYFITAMISETLMTCDKKSSIEQLIMVEARDRDKDVLGLETIEFQASIFDSIPYEKQAQDLVQYIDSIDKYKKTTLELVDLYRKQDIDQMDDLITKSEPGMAQYMNVLLYDRNERWANLMPEQMFQKSTLFAVGAGHLGGERGLINLLIRQGYKVKPLDNTQYNEEDKDKKMSVMLASAEPDTRNGTN